MAVYDGRLKHIHDTDIFYADDTSISTTTSFYTDTIDLGAAQAFVNIPAHIFWAFSADFSLLSRMTSVSGLAAKEGMRDYLEIQDSADGSTWNASIIQIPIFDPLSSVSSISVINASTLNAMNVGLGSIKRYSRLGIKHPTATSPSPKLKAWLRMGLTD